MDAYLTEEQQVEQLKNLWNQYGNLLTTIFVIIALSIVGWNAWLQHVEQQHLQASKVFQHLVVSYQQKDASGIAANANMLKEKFARTAYAHLAALQLAEQAVNKHDFKTAVNELQWAIDTAKHSSIKQLARIRLARLYAAQKQFPLALKELDQVDHAFYQALVMELRGDIFVKQKRNTDAQKAYKSTISLLKHQNHRRLVMMKLDNVGN